MSTHQHARWLQVDAMALAVEIVKLWTVGRNDAACLQGILVSRACISPCAGRQGPPTFPRPTILLVVGRDEYAGMKM